MKKIKIAQLVLITAIFFFVECKKEEKKKEEEAAKCTATCQNGGTCVNNACQCPDDWRGANCETYYTNTYTGTYISTNFNCGQGPTTSEIAIAVDPGNRNRLTFGSLYADMTDRTHFNIPKQGVMNFTGSGTIDGKTMTLNYTGTYTGLPSTTCNGNFTKK